jgi:hypothetical protein
MGGEPGRKGAERRECTISLDHRRPPMPFDKGGGEQWNKIKEIEARNKSGR